MNNEMNNELILDGWGDPFPTEKQELHWAYIKYALDRQELEAKLPKLPPIQCDWKPLPAGYRNPDSRGSGV